MFTNDDPLNATDPTGGLLVSLMGAGTQTAVQQQATLDKFLNAQGIYPFSVIEEGAISEAAEAQTLLYDAAVEVAQAQAAFEYIVTHGCYEATSPTCQLEIAQYNYGSGSTTASTGNIGLEVATGLQLTYDAIILSQAASKSWVSFGRFVTGKSFIADFAGTDEEASAIMNVAGESLEAGGDATDLAAAIRQIFFDTLGGG